MIAVSTLARFYRHLHACRRGVTVVEFAVVAPVLCLLLIGAFDIGHTLYMKAAVNGALQKAARDSTLESGTEAERQAEIDARVTANVHVLAPGADVAFTRRVYRTFSAASAARAEDYTDTNRNNTCDQGEPYEDANHNSFWDRDGGAAGQGGAKDAVVYTATITYPHMFPLYRFIGGSSQAVIKASTVLRNQPYGDQGSHAPPVIRNCT